METVFECLMLSAFVIAMCILIYYFAKDKSTNIKAERTIAWTMTVGFALGVVRELIFPPVRRLLVLYAIGTIFFCTAAAFFLSYHSEDENNEEKQINE